MRLGNTCLISLLVWVSYLAIVFDRSGDLFLVLFETFSTTEPATFSAGNEMGGTARTRPINDGTGYLPTEMARFVNAVSYDRDFAPTFEVGQCNALSKSLGAVSRSELVAHVGRPLNFIGWCNV